ncbi:hypothetical protein ACTHSI_25625, partial [Neisseria sp. P0001.S004]
FFNTEIGKGGYTAQGQNNRHGFSSQNAVGESIIIPEKCNFACEFILQVLTIFACKLKGNEAIVLPAFFILYLIIRLFLKNREEWGRIGVKV